MEGDACYSVPENPSLTACREWAAAMPELASPSVLGLNENAAAAANERESSSLLRHTLATQPQLRFSAIAAAAAAGAAVVDGELTSQAMLRRVRRDLIAAVPEDLDAGRIAEQFPISERTATADEGEKGEGSLASPLSSILRLEVGRCGRTMTNGNKITALYRCTVRMYYVGVMSNFPFLPLYVQVQSSSGLHP